MIDALTKFGSGHKHRRRSYAYHNSLSMMSLCTKQKALLATYLLLALQVSVKAFSSVAAPPCASTASSPIVGIGYGDQLTSVATQDRAILGTLEVPHVGVGTIAWSSDSGTKHNENPSIACLTHAFDFVSSYQLTAYGAPISCG